MYMLLTCNTFYHHCCQFVQDENVHELGELTFLFNNDSCTSNTFCVPAVQQWLYRVWSLVQN